MALVITWMCLRPWASSRQLRRDLVAAKLTLLEFRISLYRALAGSFETERESNEEQE
ncbi:MAG: hypothetical protein U5L96_14845 [Owenweeksia sp.]|nr:hypothetical protein [Owenweeksia sp.]